MTSNSTSSRHRFNFNRRTQLLAAFDRSGLSAAAFARKHGLNYTTFCGWRQRRDKAARSPQFVELEIASSPTPEGLVIELGPDIHIRVVSAWQAELAAALLAGLRKERAC